MAVEKIAEFAKTGQKNTDGLDQEAGFPVNLKPARQWFNFLFNKLTSSINALIDENYIRHNEIVDNLVTNDKDKPLSAAQGKYLKDNKLEISKNLSDLSDYLKAKKNLGLDKFAQNPNLNTAVGAPNVDAAIIISDSGWGIYKNSSATNFDPALPMSSGGTGRTDGKAQALVNARNIALSGAVSGSANFDGSGNIIINTALNQGFGAGQTRQNLTMSRFFGTTYTNTTAKPRFVSVTSVGGNSLFKAIVGGEEFASNYSTYNSGEPQHNISVMVLPGESYSFTGGTKKIWWEIG